MTYRQYASALPYVDFSLCVAVDLAAENTASYTRLREKIGVLQKRFGFSVSLVAVSPGNFTTGMCRQWMQAGVVAQVVWGGDGQYLFEDLVITASRSHKESVILINSSFADSSFAPFLKFLVENSYTESGVRVSSCGSFLMAPTNDLKGLHLDTSSGDWGDFVSHVAEALRQGKAVNAREAAASVEVQEMIRKLRDTTSALPAAELFITKEGVSRFGGPREFASKNISIGGVLAKDFARIWVVDGFGKDSDVIAVDESKTQWRTVRGIDRMKDSSRNIVFDINPAPSTRKASATFNVPRQVLHARVLDDVALSKPKVDAPTAVFIVSNFNKEPYIHSTLYSIVCQTYPNILVEMVDDVSTDGSVERAREFQALLSQSETSLHLSVNPANRGTYWIRNSVIARYLSSSAFYFVNDSDDYSSAQRALIQVAVQSQNPTLRGCFGDIVRVGSDYSLLPLNNQVERYGTASLSCSVSLHDEIGFFQNVKKNADTEFIERVKKFVATDAMKWIRYPLLFQPFDGGNLTADIYEMGRNGRSITQSLSNRAAHTDAFRKHHERIPASELSIHFSFPVSSMPNEYRNIGSDYLIPGYRSIDGCMLVFPREPDKKIAESLLKKKFLLAWRVGLRWQIQPPGLPAYVSSLTFRETLGIFCEQRRYYGYVVSSSMLPESGALSLKNPREFIGRVLKPAVMRSKQEADRNIYIDAQFLPAETETLLNEDTLVELIEKKQIFFHTEVLATLSVC